MGEVGGLEEASSVFQPRHVPQLVPWVWHRSSGFFSLCGGGQPLPQSFEVGLQASLNNITLCVGIAKAP